jgi:hypothetical protein
MYSRCVDDTWTEIIGGRDEPVMCAMIRYLGGEGNRVPTARLVAEAEKQAAARKGLRPGRAVKSRQEWAGEPINPELLARQGTDSKEHNERTRLKYAHLTDESPELFT